MNYGIYVGVSLETVQEISSKIIEIMSVHADQETIRCALGVLGKATKSPDYTTISGCSINEHSGDNYVQEDSNEEDMND